MLKNAESDAELKGLEVDSLVVEHIRVNKAPEMRHRTCRAHGRVNPHTLSLPHRDDPTEKGQAVPKPEEEAAQKKMTSQKKLKKQNLMAQEHIQHEINTNKSKKTKNDTRGRPAIKPLHLSF